MAKITVKYVCGCGFKTENLLGAVLHCDQQGHSMEATGTITKDQKEKKGD